MSVVTTIVITTSIMEGVEDADGNDRWPAIERLNAALGGGEWFKPVHRHAGGNKCAQADVFMAAINHLHLPHFLALMRSVAWEEPEAVLLLVNEEEDAGFSVVDWRAILAKQGCGAKLAPGQWYATCGEWEQGAEGPVAFCTQCGGDLLRLD